MRDFTTYSIPFWKPDTPFHVPPDMQMTQDFCMLMLSLGHHKIYFHAILVESHPKAFVDEEILVNFHMLHIPRLLELVLKQK